VAVVQASAPEQRFAACNLLAACLNIGLLRRSVIMPNRILFLVCLVLGLAACAQSPRQSGDVKPLSAADVMRAPLQPVTCEQTGSRIPRKADEQTPQPCRAYSGEDIDRTGTTSLEDALRRLDPAIQ
jgi:hypothetical protein